MEPEIREVIPKEFQEPKVADTFRAGDFGEGFQIEFGLWGPDSTVEVLARIRISDQKFPGFFVAVGEAMMKYAKKQGILPEKASNSCPDRDSASDAGREETHR